MPPLVPTSMNSIPRAVSASARRCESRKFELPPSMTTSPRARCGTSWSMVLSTGAPAGTITQTTRRGGRSRATSARSFAALTPFPTCALTASALRSYTISSCPPPWGHPPTICPPAARREPGHAGQLLPPFAPLPDVPLARVGVAVVPDQPVPPPLEQPPHHVPPIRPNPIIASCIVTAP